MKVSNLSKAAELAAGLEVPKSGQRLSQSERFLLAAADKFEASEPSNWAVEPSSVVEAIDALAAANPTSGAGGVGTAKVVSALYDFSVDGGAIGAISLGVAIPDNAIILEVIQDVLVEVVSASGAATLEVGAVVLSGDVVADAIGVSSVGASLPKKISTPGNLELQVATGAITAGKVRCFVRYVISE